MADFDADGLASRIDLAEAPDFELGGLQIRPARRQVCRNGECHELQPRVMQVLVALASARSGVVSRDQLIDACWDGRIVGDDALNRCVLALRHLAKEFQPEPFTIETIPRVGYSLIERSAAGPPRRRGLRAGILVGALVLLAVAVIALVLAWPRLAPGDPEPASIAVIPFRNLSGGDPYFAEGVGEEILGQLAREPQFRIVGRSSSNQLRDADDIGEVGRRLDVDYVLEGSVRHQGAQVRVTAALVRTRDGTQLWTDSYDGRLDDIFVIQQRIGGAIAGALRRRLVQANLPQGALATSGDVYNLYLTARGLIRTRDARKVEVAGDLLRRALAIDPNYAPAWASLAHATWISAYRRMNERQAAGDGSLEHDHQRAVRYAQRALALAPDLAEAHAAMGIILFPDPSRAAFHVERAAQLDPGSAQNVQLLGGRYGDDAMFERQLATYRRAEALDPLWFRPAMDAAVLAQELGDDAEAERHAARLRRIGWAEGVAGRHAHQRGDYSEALRRWSAAAARPASQWHLIARENRDDVLILLGLRNSDPAREQGARSQHLQGRLSRPPSPDLWRLRNRSAPVSAYNRQWSRVAAKLMLNAGRHRELIQAYDGPVGLVGLSPQRAPARAELVAAAPLAALALRRSGRTAEADRLLARADAAVAFARRQGRIPYHFRAEAAQVWAVQGRQDAALAELERILASGWRGSGLADFDDLGDEPAFAGLRGNPRFERIRAAMAAHYERERREARALRL